MIYRCKEAFATQVAGVKRVVPAGELVEDTDPVFKGRERLFEPVGDYVSRRGSGVERATAEPGEKRVVSTVTAEDEKPKRGPGRPRKTPTDGGSKAS
ncbi:hypothetical protein CDO52_00755 [Nocardiopsis gilva YIM 90087]|uniref:Uncharacterized protein n=1 Tax=Nocardiopsis gilva YIM 90087 TaxID=1235441 RepID=A0A223S0G0_9ACTN|nr:hypothetical protein CDO52_00755 [Nocardiopsis gilva YIM 90087]